MQFVDYDFDVAAFERGVEDFLTRYPDTQRLELLLVDINGALRGKWLPVSSLKKLSKGTFRIPRTACFADIWSDDTPELGLGLDVGDPDGICLPIIETLAPVPWASVPSAQMLLTMIDQADMRPCQYAPRVTLQKQLSRFAAQGLKPVVATELEFYFIDPVRRADGEPQRPLDANGERLREDQQYSMALLEQYDAVLQDILDTAQLQNLPVDTTIAECGPGQFEINLLHCDDALLAADQAILLKRLIKCVARRHGLRASFMAKVYAEEMGNGLHVHASLNDASGHNIFSSDNGEIHPQLAHAVAGLLKTMQATQLVYAPHANSYRRYAPGFFAPVSPCWGYDHRAAAVRVPSIDGADARLEHRVSGADANPYLVIAAVLAGMHRGLADAQMPQAALSDETDLSALVPMTRHWAIAIEQMEQSDFVAEYFGSEMQRVFCGVKHSEEQTFANWISRLEYDTYLLKV
ncbi:MAG: glutamine synthetase family protein [Pseudomonadales bacterium]